MMVGDTLGVVGGSAGTSGNERLLIEFELAGESYGVEISTVREIMRLQEITRLSVVPDVWRKLSTSTTWWCRLSICG
jgi:hypothetical protein